MPTVLVALTGPLAFLGAAAGHWVARLTAREQERWRRREETMRLLRWGTELAAQREPRSREIGLAALGALVTSPLVDHDDIAFIDVVFEAASRSVTYTDSTEVLDE